MIPIKSWWSKVDEYFLSKVDEYLERKRESYPGDSYQVDEHCICMTRIKSWWILKENSTWMTPIDENEWYPDNSSHNLMKWLLRAKERIIPKWLLSSWRVWYLYDSYPKLINTKSEREIILGWLLSSWWLWSDLNTCVLKCKLYFGVCASPTYVPTLVFCHSSGLPYILQSSIEPKSLFPRSCKWALVLPYIWVISHICRPANVWHD